MFPINSAFTKILIAASLMACWSAPVASAEELTVAAAANSSATVERIAQRFRELNPGVQLKTVIGSSGQLSAQIEHGAPFDVFLSADMEYPSILHKKGFAQNEPEIYAFGTLVLWTTRDIDLKDGILILNSPHVRKVALANPRTAPYGRESIKAIDHLNLRNMGPKLVYGESISQVNQFILQGIVDVGLTSQSSVLSSEVGATGSWVAVDQKYYSPIAQGAVVLKHGKLMHPELSEAFYKFLFSDEARRTLVKFGYQLP